MSVTLGVRPSSFLDIDDPTEALLWDISILEVAKPPKSVKDKILEKRRRLGIRSYRV